MWQVLIWYTHLIPKEFKDMNSGMFSPYNLQLWTNMQQTKTMLLILSTKAVIAIKINF